MEGPKGPEAAAQMLENGLAAEQWRLLLGVRLPELRHDHRHITRRRQRQVLQISEILVRIMPWQLASMSTPQKA